MVFELGGALDASVAHLANFHWVELIPFPLMELSVEISNKLSVYEIEKGIANITVVLSDIKFTL